MAVLGKVALDGILKVAADCLQVGGVILDSESSQQTSRGHSGGDLDEGQNGSEDGEESTHFDEIGIDIAEELK